MNCPKCNIELTGYNRNGLNIYYCKNCKAVWISFAALQKIGEWLDLKAPLVNPVDMDPLKIKEELRNCPTCAKTMHKVFFNGIIADKCVDCKSVWFDNGELSKYFSLFMKQPAGVIDNLVFLENVFTAANKKQQLQAQSSAQPQNKQSESEDETEHNHSVAVSESKPHYDNQPSAGAGLNINGREEERKVISINGFFMLFVFFQKRVVDAGFLLPFFCTSASRIFLKQ